MSLSKVFRGEYPVGSKGHWNPELNLKRGQKCYAFAPNSLYVVGDVIYETDSFPRLVKVGVLLQRVVAVPDRHASQQRLVGKLVKQVGDDGGHVIATSLGGSGQAINMVPMNSELNRWGEWREMEREVKAFLDGGEKVFMDIRFVYRNPGLRPDRIVVNVYLLETARVFKYAFINY